MTTTLTANKDESTIFINGDLTLGTVNQLWSHSLPFFSNINTPIYVNLEKVKKGDSAGVALLIAWVRLAQRQNKKVYFVHLPEQMLATIQVSGLTELLPLVKT